MNVASPVRELSRGATSKDYVSSVHLTYSTHVELSNAQGKGIWFRIVFTAFPTTTSPRQTLLFTPNFFRGANLK